MLRKIGLNGVRLLLPCAHRGQGGLSKSVFLTNFLYFFLRKFSVSNMHRRGLNEYNMVIPVRNLLYCD